MTNETMNWKNALKLSLLLSLFWALIALFGKFGTSSWTETDIDFMEMFVKTLSQFAIVAVLNFVLFCFQFFIFNKKWKLNKKLLVSVVGSCLLMVGSIGLFIIGVHFFNVLPHEQPEFTPNVFFIFVPSIIISVITVLITFVFYIIKEREKNLTEIQKLSVENIRSRYEALKNQLDPHFLFNSLNTLNGLIGYDDTKAREYVHKLSSVFRYTIQNKEVRTLKDELDFTDSFYYLMKIRYNGSLQVDYKINDKYLDYQVMPLSLQLLIENAVKHNVISNKNPLIITVETTDNNSIVVANKIQPKNEPSSGEGIGLANLTERYKLLYQKEVKITKNDNTFIVEIPLIKSVDIRV
jgi:sensor histidine kinase YesM